MAASCLANFILTGSRSYKAENAATSEKIATFVGCGFATSLLDFGTDSSKGAPKRRALLFLV